jgi:hypothetical protein
LAKYKKSDDSELMKVKTSSLTILFVTLCIMAIAPCIHAEPTKSQEYNVKAAFLFNFIKFVDWPTRDLGDANEPLIIGIIGKDPFKDNFGVLKDKQVKGRNVTITRFKGIEELEEAGQKRKDQLYPQIEIIRKCHLLFICSSEKEHVFEIVNLVRNHSILTVADMDGFLGAGGIINFLMEEKKVRFEINVKTAKQAELNIRSKLLRLAKRVIE